MVARTSVIGPGAHPFYVARADASSDALRWNSHKFLANRSGKVVATFPSSVDPLDGRVTKQIEAPRGRSLGR